LIERDEELRTSFTSSRVSIIDFCAKSRHNPGVSVDSLSGGPHSQLREPSNPLISQPKEKLMTLTNPQNESSQEKRIQRMREEIEKLGGIFSVDSEMPADLEEEFLKQVLEYERAEPMTVFRLLENAGFDLPLPDCLDDAALTAKLEELIDRMASLGAYLLNTNHLSDRELYQYLYDEGLREEATLFPENPGYAYMIDLTGSGSSEDMQVYLKYYADEDFRQRWAKDWPDDPMPKHEDPPFDRDAKLPKSLLG
jgi:uncharacterized protein YaaR (DUF327 family)